MNFIKRFFNSGSAEREAFKDSPVLFSEGATYWRTFRPIVEELVSRKIHFRYCTLDARDPALESDSQYMQARAFSGAMGFVKLGLVRAPVMLATTPNIGNPEYPMKRSPHVKTLVHVFHAMGNVEYYRKGSLDSYDAVIMTGDHEAQYIRTVEKARNLPEKELVALGLPYLDDMYRELQSRRAFPEESPESPTVLVAPSWGEKGCFTEYGTDFVESLSRSGYRVIIRLHPHSYEYEPDKVESWQAATRDLAGVEWDREMHGLSAMDRSDICISDTSSIRFDYAFLCNKPVITLSVPQQRKSGFEACYFDTSWDTALSQEIGAVMTHPDISDLPDIVHETLKGFSPHRLRELRNRHLKNFGKSAQAIAQYIQDKASG